MAWGRFRLVSVFDFLGVAALAVGLASFAGPAHATTVLSENFDSLPSNWVIVNNSIPVGPTAWFQGNAGAIQGQQGGASSYAAANFLNASVTGGNVSDWYITPVVPLGNGDVLTFFTISAGDGFADRLQVRLSSNGASTDVGTTDTSVGDFTDLLLDINPALDPNAYPTAWTQYSVTLSGLAGSTAGRLAFRYFVTDTNSNGNYIGLDTVSLSSAAQTPIPATLPLLASGLGVVGLLGWRRKRIPG